VALTPDASTARRLGLVWGLEPRIANNPKDLDDMTDQAVATAVRLGLAKPLQRILILAGTPFGAPGAANLLRFAHAPMK
jgi:pyruvate kinase